MRFYPLRHGVVLLALVCIVSLSWIKSIPGDGGPTVWPDLHGLYERLHVAEELGTQVSRDLNRILERLKNMSGAANVTSLTNITFSPTGYVRQLMAHSDQLMFFQQPSIFHYMPHLRQHPDSLLPNVVLGHGRRGVSIVMGIPTVKREKQSYLVNTISSLMYSLTPTEHQDLLIIVFVAEKRHQPEASSPWMVSGVGNPGIPYWDSLLLRPSKAREAELINDTSAARQMTLLRKTGDTVETVKQTDSDYVNNVAETIRKNFPEEVESGLLEVVSPSRYYYPDFSNLKETFGDSMDRVKWRTKQNLDFSFLMIYAQNKGTYYVQLEDDVIAKTGYFNDMKTFATQEATKQWLFLEFSQLGFIGKMFRTQDLPMIAEFFLMFHKDKPIDWLLDHILWVKVCNPEKNEKECNLNKASLKHRYKPSLFQHVGLHSSLPGKLQHLKDKDFGKQRLFQAHSNPAAELKSSLKHYQQHSLERAYQGQDFFWVLTPTKDDYILFTFPKPIFISSYLFRSGNVETSGDKFHNTTVEVLPSNVSARDRLLAQPNSTYKESDKGFVIIGAFRNGLAEGKIEDALQPISALRLVVQSDADVWAVLSEIFIKVR